MKSYIRLLILILNRYCWSFTPGYFHPDEHIQGPQIVSNSLKYLPKVTPYEFKKENCLRSPFVSFLTTTLVIYFDFFGYESVEILLFLVRFITVLISFSIDLCIIKIKNFGYLNQKSFDKIYYYHITNWIIQVLLIRTFQSSILASLLAIIITLCIDLNHSNMEMDKKTFFKIIGLGFLFGTALFTHSSAIIFLVVPGIFFIYDLVRRNKFFKVVKNFIIAFLLTIIFFITLDTLYFNQSIREKPVIYLIKNFKYNTNKEMLKKHGLNPFYFHFTINFFLLFGLQYIELLKILLKLPKDPIGILLRGSIIFPLIIFSMIPHQEIKFLIPLYFPVYILLSKEGNLEKYQKFTEIYNFIISLFYSFIHQGGIIRSINLIKDNLRNDQVSLMEDDSKEVEILIQNTYNFPSYLLLNKNPKIIVNDIGENEEIKYNKNKLQYLISTKIPTNLIVNIRHFIYLSGILEGNNIWKSIKIMKIIKDLEQ